MEERNTGSMPHIPEAITIRDDLSIQRCVPYDTKDNLNAIRLLGQRPFEVIRELLHQGGSIDKRTDFQNNTPLNFATYVGLCNVELVKMLLEHGADVDTMNEFHDTPLIHAIRNFTESMVLIRIILKAGASINLKNLNGETALLTALKNPRCTMVLIKELLKYKADINCKDRNGRTPLNYAKKYLKNNWLEIVKMLMKQGCDINAINFYGDKNTLRWTFLYNRDREILFWKSLIQYAVLKCTNHLELAHLDTVVLDYFSTCKEEVDFMKKHIIDDGISVYDFVMSKAVRTTLVDKLLETLKKNPFPVYYDLIFKKAKKAALLNVLSEHRLYTCVSQGDTMRKITLDGDSIINICIHLKINDLENLVHAYSLVFKEINWCPRPLKRLAEEIPDVISKPQISPKRMSLYL